MRMPAGCIRQDASPHGKGDSACLLPKPMKATIQLSAESILRDDILSGHKPSLAGDAALPRGSLSSCRCIDHTALNQTQSDNSLNTAIQSNNQKKHGFNRCNDQAIVGEHCEHGNGSFPPSLSSTGISSTYEDLHLRSFTPMDACSVDSDSDNTHHKHPLFHCGSAVDQGTRRTMEDQHTMLSEGIPFFGVYDGHGGTQCAEYLRDNLHQMILSHTEIKTNPEKAIYDGITEADRLFLQRSEVETNESGSVCAVALILDDVLVVGNVGDCEAVLSRRGAPVVLTKKHNLQSNPAEMQRLKDAGGKIFHNRVGHPKFNPSVMSLAVTRAIGDAGFKLDEYTDGRPSGVIAEPDTSSTKLTHEDEFLIIGCDGLWDVMTYEEVVEACSRLARTLDPSADVSAELSELLLQEALLQGSSDNITVIVVELNIPKNHRCSCSDSG